MNIAPGDTFIHEGYPFKVITITQAYALLKDLKGFQENLLYGRLNNQEDDENSFFLLAEENAELDKLLLDFEIVKIEETYVSGFIFLKSLQVKTYIAVVETDGSPALIVLENLTAGNIALGGNTFYIGGTLSCETIIGDYNHGELFVKGVAYAALIYSDDMGMHFGGFGITPAVYNYMDRCITLNALLQQKDSSTFRKELRLPDNIFLSDLVWDAFIETDDDGKLQLIAGYNEQAVLKNITFIDPEKAASFASSNSQKGMVTVFAAIKKLLTAQQRDKLEYFDAEENCSYTIELFEHNNKPFLRFQCREWNFDIRMGGTMSSNNPLDNYLYLEYLNDAGEVQYTWDGTFSSINFEMKTVMHHARKTLMAITNECETPLQSKKKKTANAIVPFETMTYEGHTYKVINPQQAHELLQELTDLEGDVIYNVLEDDWRFPSYEENGIFLLAEEDVQLPAFEPEYSSNEHPDIFIYGFIFLKSLKVENYIMAYDLDNSPTMIVMGDLSATNIALFGNVFYVGGNLTAETIIGQYNHGELFVKGNTKASLIYSDDMRMHFNSLDNATAVYNFYRPDISVMASVKQTDGSIVHTEVYLPSNIYLSDVIYDEFIEIDDYGKERLIDEYTQEVVLKNRSFIDKDKWISYGEKYSKAALQKLLIDTAALLEAQQTDELFFDDEGYDAFTAKKFIYENNAYTILRQNIRLGFYIEMTGVMQIDNAEENDIALRYLDDNGNVKFEWRDLFGSTIFYLKSAAHHLIAAFKKIETNCNAASKKENETIKQSIAEKLNQLMLSATTTADNPYHDLWRQWITEIIKTTPQKSDYFNLKQGITEEEIKHSHWHMKIPLPQALQDFYSVFDVEYNAVTSVFCFAMNNWSYDLIPFKRIAGEWKNVQDLVSGDDEIDAAIYSSKIKISNYANANWIPFAEGRNGDLLLFDCDPGDAGVYGQIIELQNESWERNVVASSLEELIQKQIEDLEERSG